jgi:protease I
MKQKHVLIITPLNGFRDEELFEPKSIFEKNKIKVTVASTSIETGTGMVGGKFIPDILINDINVEDYDAVVLVGGMGADTYWDNILIHDILKEAYSKDKIIAAICISPITLANAGLLQGKRATVLPREIEKLKSLGVIYTENKVEIDGRIITAIGPNEAGEWGEAILNALQ